MRKIALAALIIATPAFADQPAPYAPITISEQDYRALQTYLGDQPMKFSSPIAAWLNSAEAIAVKKAADDKAKAEQKANPVPEAPAPKDH